MFANSQFGGMDLGLPDVCKTPVPPIPYPNIAPSVVTIPVAFNYLIMGGPEHNMASIRPFTTGDVPGVGLGVASQTIIAKQNHVTGSFTNILRGTPVTRLTSIGPTNVFNCPPACRIVPSQFKVISLAP
ncbi:conserved hypothetical protein [Taylorella asinigenitalis 14/45]|uniref:Uncharacterized protein n=1 Tax=Taylorella asinigenitalis 14/45 TaxID=1091495 RepID=I7ILE5_9BURK|nr:DUF4150 domain-containing protein [Taylorella asinigenitalis]CCG20014.1 conserved hypothetical protein [Taylorella asinigenitalis 14/45]